MKKQSNEEKYISVFIKGNIPSSKNSKINTSRGSFNSKTVQKWLKYQGIKSYSSSKKEVELYKTTPIIFPIEELKELFSNCENPITIGFHFVRNSKHKWDFHNAVQILLDLFTAFDIIPDDNMDYIIPQCLWVNDKHYTYDKNNAGVIVVNLTTSIHL